MVAAHQLVCDESAAVSHKIARYKVKRKTDATLAGELGGRKGGGGEQTWNDIYIYIYECNNNITGPTVGKISNASIPYSNEL